MNHESESFKYLISIKFDFHENTYELTSSFVLLISFVMEPLVKGQWCTVIPTKHTVYPTKYAHGFCFAVLCCGYTLTDFPISIRLTSLALWQSNDCPSASKATLMNMDKYFMWIHYERLHNNNKAKHNKTVCIFLGIYCIGVNTTLQNTPRSLNVVTPRHGINFVINPNRMVIKQSNCRGFEKPRRSCYFTVIT